MRTLPSSLPRQLLAWLTASSAAALLVTACSGDEFVAPPAQGGSAGSSGSSGSSGAAGSGRGGSAGAAGKSGGAGASGAAGQPSAGAAGSAGAGASSGSGGASGTAGSAGSGGAAPPGACSESSPKYRCIGTQVLQQCNPSTKLYETLQKCEAPAQCNAATQTCDACKAGAPDPDGECASGGVQRVCSADGKGYTDTKACPAGASVCKKNVCEGCSAPTDCPAPTSVCQVAACTSAKCGIASLPKGPPPGAPPATGCVAKVCDGAGNLVDAASPAGTICGVDKRCDDTGACLPCLPAPGATAGSSTTACADGLVCDSDDLSNVADALFVAPAPTGIASNTGTATSPLSLEAALAKLTTTPGIRRVYISQGTYDGPLTASGVTQDVVIEGGIVRNPDGTWRRDCAAGAFQGAKIAQAGKTGAALTWSSQGALEIRSLLIRSDVAAPATYATTAASSTALMVQKAAKVKLVAVALEAGAAQAGSKGANGYTPLAPFSQNCPAGTGLPGQAGAPALPQPGLELFTQLGFQPGKGLSGNAGTPGANGAEASTTARERIHYVDRCPPFLEPSGDCRIFDDLKTFRYVAPGYNGCGGGGGVAGEPGWQGGGSFGLYLGDVPAVELVASRVSARLAGAGGPGGPGAEGAIGTNPGFIAEPSTAWQDKQATCNADSVDPGTGRVFCKRNANGLVTATEAPQPGGKGASGGKSTGGSSGRGGPVVALVSRADAVITQSSSSALLASEPSAGGQTPGEAAASTGMLAKTHTY